MTILISRTGPLAFERGHPTVLINDQLRVMDQSPGMLVELKAGHMDILGIPRTDIVIDAVCLATAAVPNSMQITLDTIKVLSQEMGLATVLGIGNAGYGMPIQTDRPGISGCCGSLGTGRRFG